MTIVVIKYIFAFIVAYIIGSIPTGYIAVKTLKHQDVRETGSGSTGATNVKRVLGTKWFFIVLLLDALKGAICVLIAHHFFDFYLFYGLASALAGTGAILGHSRSVFLKFTGGKSVATGVGTLIAICPSAGLIVAAIWATLTFATKMVSFGSIFALALAPLIMQIFSNNDYFFWYSCFCAIYIIIMHKDNIKRLIDGTENKIRK